MSSQYSNASPQEEEKVPRQRKYSETSYPFFMKA